jgi:hypothetical protein
MNMPEFDSYIVEGNADDLLKMNQDFDRFVSEWAITELHKSKPTDSKLTEILVFNFKHIFSEDPEASKLRSYLFNTEQVELESKDYMHSRIQDLYIVISMRYPEWFLAMKKDAFINTIKSLGYEVSDSLVKLVPYGWLFQAIQFQLRYRKENSHIYKNLL